MTQNSNNNSEDQKKIEILKDNENKIIWWILGTIIFIGIFIRLWHLNDYTRFNQDQARHAKVIDQIVNDHQIILLGPHAAGTDFRLGPSFYYLHGIIALFLGTEPQTNTYLTVFLAILAIPLFYYFLRFYFSSFFACGITFLFSISYFAIKYARFAWNPNDSPFFIIIILISLQKILINQKKQSLLWAIILGLSLGILSHLHTLFLFIFPLMSFMLFVWFSIKNKFIPWKTLILSILAFLFINIPFISTDIQNKGYNFSEFIKGFEEKNEISKSTSARILKNMECFSQGSLSILSWTNSDGKCSILNISRADKTPISIQIIESFFSVFIFFGGLIILVVNFKKEENKERKDFLAIILSLILSSFIIFFPIAFEAKTRFFITLIFIPFIFLGLAAQSIFKSSNKKLKIIFAFFLGIILCLNFWAIYTNIFSPFVYSKHNDLDGTITLGEAQCISSYISQQYQDHPDLQNDMLLGEFSYYHPVQYLTNKANTPIIHTNRDFRKLESGKNVFYPLEARGYVSFKTKNDGLFEELGTHQCDRFIIFWVKKI